VVRLDSSVVTEIRDKRSEIEGEMIGTGDKRLIIEQARPT
jgi:hypothetical protein